MRDRIIDSTLTFVLLSVGAAVLAGMLIMLVLSSCSSGEAKKKGVREVAEESIMLLADRPESVRVIAFSEPDSVFGRSFFSDSELSDMLDKVSRLNDRFMAPDSGISDPSEYALLQRGAVVADILQAQIENPSVGEEFSGWKVKAAYECVDRFGDTVRNEKYFIFDKKMAHIIHSFDIPIL